MLGSVMGLVLVAAGSAARPTDPPPTAMAIPPTLMPGRKLTSDRPIMECLDREQKVLNPSGTVKTKIGPSLTPQNAPSGTGRTGAKPKSAKSKPMKSAASRVATRYPTKAVHDQETQEPWRIMAGFRPPRRAS